MPFRPPRLLSLPSRLSRRARRRRLETMIIIGTVVSVFFWTLYSIYKPPTMLISYFQYRWPDVLWRVQTTRKIVALTIDDTPSEFTQEILDILKANDASATFFVIGGQVHGREYVLADIVKAGHELGNHAMHDEPSRSLDDQTLRTEIKSVERMVTHAYETANNDPAHQNIGTLPHYFRPGSGFFSQRMLSTVKELGYQLVLGNVYPHDAQISWSWLNARHILSMVRPGSIIICHDRRRWTAPMLKRVLPRLKKQGYEVISISQLLSKTKQKDGKVS